MKCNRKKLKICAVVVVILLLFSLFSFKISKNVKKIYIDSSIALCNKFVYNQINLTTDRIVIESESLGELVKTHKDEQGKITAIFTNVNAVNILSNQVAVECQKDLQENSPYRLKLPLGSFTGSVLLSDRGRRVNVPLTVHYTVKSDFKPLAENIGINVIRYCLYLAVTTTCDIALPYNEEKAVFTTYILVNESIFTGEIPDTYIGSQDGLEYLDLLP